jgi:hypothetical protein
MNQFDTELQLKALMGSFIVLLDQTIQAMQNREPEMARKVERLVELGLCEAEGRIEFHPVPALVISMRMEDGALLEVARLNVPAPDEYQAQLDLH